MSMAPTPLPPAVLHERTAWKRWLITLGKTPRWASMRSTWALSAGCSAAAFHFLSGLAKAGQLDALYGIGQLNLETVVLCCIATLIVTFAFYIPLWLSAGLYFLFFARRSRASAVLWCTCFHTAAHLGVGALFNATLDAASFNLHVPMIIGAVWGAWLPGTVDDLTEQRL